MRISTIWAIVAIGMILFLFYRLFSSLYRLFSKSRIKGRIEALGQDLDNQRVKSFITFIRTASIPNEPQVWNALRAGCKLVWQNSNIDIELKKELRQVLLSRGVNI